MSKCIHFLNGVRGCGYICAKWHYKVLTDAENHQLPFIHSTLDFTVVAELLSNPFKAKR